MEERLNSGTTADRQFVWGLMGLDNLILRDRSTERFYLTGDVFNATAIVNTSGTVQERYGYAAFGQPRFMDGNFSSRTSSSYDWETLFGDYRYDAESEYYQVRYRYLHPTLGRWLASDPIEYLDGNNLYQYVKNSPIVGTDSLGLKSFRIIGKSFINGPGPIGSLGWRWGLSLPGLPFGVYPWYADLRLQIFVKLLIKYTASGPFNQNPTDDSEDGQYRLFARRNVEITCNGDTLVGYSEGIPEHDGGVEFSLFGLDLVSGTIDSSSRFSNKTSDSINYELFTWGHPNTVTAEPGMQWVALRTSVNIWHKANIKFSCKDGTPRCSVNSFNGSCYPSRRLWINGGVAKKDVNQGALSSLWTADSADRTFVAAC